MSLLAAVLLAAVFQGDRHSLTRLSPRDKMAGDRPADRRDL